MNAHHVRRSAVSSMHARGFTIVELMIAMLLGLIVIAGVSSVFLANLRSYNSNTALSDVQSNSRIAFELMARDIRQAGLTGCNSTTSPTVNVLNNGPSGASTLAWWADWNNVVYGIDSTQVDSAITASMPARAASTDSLIVLEATGQGFTVASAATSPPSLTLQDDHAGLQTGDIVIACNPDHSALMQVTAASGSPIVIAHATGGSTPGNFATGPNFMANSKLSPLAAHDWYVGVNATTGVRSLYRITLSLVSGVPTPTAQEMVRNVTDMQITYHQAGDAKFLDAFDITNWGAVDAVHIDFTLQSTDQRAGTDAKPLTRTFSSTTAIRNRNVTP